MEFTAELKQATSRKTASNDMVYKIVFETSNPQTLDLGKLPSDSLFNISVTLHNSTEQKTNIENEGYEQI